MRNAYKILVVIPEGKRPLGRPGHGWENNIRMDLRQIGWEGVDLMHLAQNRDHWRDRVNTAMNLWVPYEAENFLTIFELTLSFS
jgi:hypothetical protein